MLKKILLLICFFGISLTFPETSQSAKLEVDFSDYTFTSLSFTAGELILSETKIPNGNFTYVDMPGANPSAEIGEPQLPVIRFWVEIPQDCEPEVSLTNQELDSLFLYDYWLPSFIYPRQAPVPKIKNYRSDFIVDWHSYLSNQFRYKEAIKILTIVQARDHRLAHMEIRPVNYNPVAGKLVIISTAKIEIHTPDANIEKTRRIKQTHHSKHYDEIIEPYIVNYEFWEKWVPPTEIEMIIITGSTYSSALADLVQWKHRKGYKLDLKTVSELGGTANSVKNYIQTQYDSDDVDFVLLVGDVADMPTFSGGASSSSSDNPYSELAGADIIPDCFVGRLSLNSTASVTEMVNRIIDYEHFDFGTGTDWTWRVSLPTTDDASFHSLAEATQRYVAQNLFDPYGYTYIDTIWAYYGGTGSQVISDINSGVMLVIYTGHGYYTEWDAPAVNQSDVASLTNSGMYPMILSFACLTGTFGERDECFMETWIRQTDAAAIADLGASNSSYWDEDDVMERRMLDSVFVEEWMFTAGMRLKGLMAVYNSYPSSAEYYFDMYNLLGDPSLALWYGAPQNLDVTHPDFISPGGGNIDFNVQSVGIPVEEALVCITNHDAIHRAEYTNSSGNVTLSYSSASPGETLWVTVTAYNKIPYEGFIIVGSDGPYLVYESNAVEDDGGSGSSGDSDGTADTQERIALWVDLRNNGSETAYGVSATLSTSSSYATIIDNNSYYGTVVDGGVVTPTDPFVVQLVGNPPDNTEINFNLNITDVDDSSWVSQFNLPVHAPQMDLSDRLLTDLGDSDGFYEPGEQVGITLTLHNSGGDDAQNIVGFLSEDDTYLSITVSDANFGTIVPGGDAANPTAYRVSIATACPTPYFAKVYHNASEDRGYSSVDTISFMIGTGGFYDDAEAGMSLWNAESPWHITDFRYNSYRHSFYSSPETGTSPFQYSNETDVSMTTANPIILPDNPALTFWHFYQMEHGYDTCFVQVSTDDGTSWNDILTFSSLINQWKFAYADLSAYGSPGDDILLRFRLHSDAGVYNHGWFIDDILVQSEMDGYIGAGDAVPWVGSAGDTFTFMVTYASPSGVLPIAANVYIDGVPYSMTDAEGAVTTGRTFYYTTPLNEDTHSYYFSIETGSGTLRFPETGDIRGPCVNAPINSYNLGTSNGGFSTVSFDYYQNWEWGTPSYGPSLVPLGSNCWGTELSGTYNDSSQSRLITPVMTIPDDGSIPYLLIWHWYRIQASDNPVKHDGGNVKISVNGGEPFTIFPQCGYNGQTSQYNQHIPWEPVYGDTLNDFWQKEAFNLSPWIGDSIRVYFDFGSSSRNTDAGWYINYLALHTEMAVGVESEKPITIPNNVSLSIFPNPFNSSCVITVPAGAGIEIFDINGKCVGAGFAPAQQQGDRPSSGIFNKSRPYIWTPDENISSGVYLIKATTKNGLTKTKRVIYLK